MRNEDMSTTNGTASISPADDVQAGSPGIWTIQYTAGPDGIEAGGSVRFEIPYGFTMPQFRWVHDPGYCDASCSQRGVEIELSYDPPVSLDPEPFYYVTHWGRMIYAQVVGERLEEGETIDLRYGWRTHTEPGAIAQHFSGHVEFTVATDTEGTRAAKFSGYTLIADQPKLTIIATKPQQLQVIAPSYAQMGEIFDAKIVVEDDNCNAIENCESRYVLDSSGGASSDAEVEIGKWHSRAQIRYGLPGEKMLTALDMSTGIAGMSNPIIVTPEPLESRLFWGDIHGHTILSDGLGTPEEYYEFGRDQACLDFCAITDHSQYISDDDWEHIQRVTREFNAVDKYVTLLGYEVSLNAEKSLYGDKNIYYPGDTGPLLRATDINRTAYANLDDYTETWKQAGAMMILHQHAGGSDTYYDPDLVRLAEVYSVWGDSEMAEGSRPLIPAQQRSFSGMLAADLLAQGKIVGFMASSDDHAGRPGRTDWLRVRKAFPGGLVAAWAPELTRESIWNALWNRRCYGTTGARIILEFSIDGQPMGSVIPYQPFAQAHKISVKVCGTNQLMAVEVLRGQQMIYVHSAYDAKCQFEFMDEPEPGDANYYYVRVLQADGEMAWSSPIWVS